MNPVPWKYRNVLNPWQTKRDIKLQSRFLDGMFQQLHLPLQEELKLLRAEEPDRDWGNPK